MNKKMTVILMAIVISAVMFVKTISAQNLPAEQRFDQTDGILARARAVEDIEYKIMVQRLSLIHI